MLTSRLWLEMWPESVSKVLHNLYKKFSESHDLKPTKSHMIFSSNFTSIDIRAHIKCPPPTKKRNYSTYRTFSILENKQHRSPQIERKRGKVKKLRCSFHLFAPRSRPLTLVLYFCMGLYILVLVLYLYLYLYIVLYICILYLYLRLPLAASCLLFSHGR